MIIDKKIHEIESLSLEKVNKFFLSYNLNNDILIVDQNLISNKYIKRLIN